MNLAEVTVAASVFLGACSAAAQMGASSTQAMLLSRQQQLLLEQFEIQFLAAPAVIRAARLQGGGGDADCRLAAGWMQQQLDAGLPTVAAGLQRSINLTGQSDLVQLAVRNKTGLQRVRVFSPAAFGLCGGEG